MEDKNFDTKDFWFIVRQTCQAAGFLEIKKIMEQDKYGKQPSGSWTIDDVEKCVAKINKAVERHRININDRLDIFNEYTTNDFIQVLRDFGCLAEK